MSRIRIFKNRFLVNAQEPGATSSVFTSIGLLKTQQNMISLWNRNQVVSKEMIITHQTQTDENVHDTDSYFENHVFRQRRIIGRHVVSLKEHEDDRNTTQYDWDQHTVALYSGSHHAKHLFRRAVPWKVELAPWKVELAPFAGKLLQPKFCAPARKLKFRTFILKP